MRGKRTRNEIYQSIRIVNSQSHRQFFHSLLMGLRQTHMILFGGDAGCVKLTCPGEQIVDLVDAIAMVVREGVGRDDFGANLFQ